MKRYHIRQMLSKQTSDAQLRRAIAELELPVDDGHEYSDNEAKRVIDHFKTQQAQSPQHSKSDRLSQSQATAQEAAEKTKVALVTNHQERLVALTSALDKAEQRRDEVLDRLSDRVAYLQDESLFMHDLLSLAQQKLKGDRHEVKEETANTAIDALVEAFDAIGEWELPALPHPCAGVLMP